MVGVRTTKGRGSHWISSRSRRLRQRRRLTQTDLTSIVGSRGTIVSKYEQGIRGPSVARAAQWAELLGDKPKPWIAVVLQQKLDDAGLGDYQVRVMRRNQRS